MVYDEGIHPRVATRQDCSTPGPCRPYCTCFLYMVYKFGSHSKAARSALPWFKSDARLIVVGSSRAVGLAACVYPRLLTHLDHGAEVRPAQRPHVRLMADEPEEHCCGLPSESGRK